ncbi:MAG: ribose-phosphate diphosphokinase [Candidatus Hodarchaeales archaeon]|jgi:ribose-phosphate pyrophosphokinase
MEIIIVGKTDFAKKIADNIPSAGFLEVEERTFPDGEICPRLLIDNRSTIQKAHTIVVLQLMLSQSKNDYLISLLLVIKNLKRLGAAKITCIMPYHIYSRQDRETRIGEPLSSHFLASLLESAGVNHFLTINSHSYGKNPLSDFFKNASATSISAIPLLSKAVKEQNESKEEIICFSPDEGALKLAKEAAEAINSPYYGTLRKKRDPDTGEVSQELIGIDISLRDRTILIVDDLVSSGGTMIGAARILKQKGVKTIYLTYVHAVHSLENFNTIKKEDIQYFFSTDTIKTEFEGLIVISVIKLIIDWISHNLLSE